MCNVHYRNANASLYGASCSGLLLLLSGFNDAPAALYFAGIGLARLSVRLPFSSSLCRRPLLLDPTHILED